MVKNYGTSVQISLLLADLFILYTTAPVILFVTCPVTGDSIMLYATLSNHLHGAPWLFRELFPCPITEGGKHWLEIPIK